jgi:hypothetical protein
LGADDTTSKFLTCREFIVVRLMMFCASNNKMFFFLFADFNLQRGANEKLARMV